MHIPIIMQRRVNCFMTYSSLLRNAFIIPICFALSRGQHRKIQPGNISARYFFRMP